MYNSPKYSLASLLGTDYADSVISAVVALGKMDYKTAHALAYEEIDFYSKEDQEYADKMLNKVGLKIADISVKETFGAPSASFRKATHLNLAPMSGKGPFRIGEDGKLYIIGKSEHYHASLGHAFSGYKLIENAHKLGILNPTHNNTRGYITRLNERTIIAEMNGLDVSDKKVDKIIDSTEKHVLNRVINLETGSLACESGIKMMLARFYSHDGIQQAKYAGKIPVFFVMADFDGDVHGNYHGTTVIPQTFRGLWPELYKAIEKAEIYKVVPVIPNDYEDFKAKIEKYNKGKYKTAGFMHETVLMNYGGILLGKEYLHKIYDLCDKYDTPTMVDEIQTGAWYGKTFIFKEMEIHPDFVVIGKGCPGGEYAASKIVTTAEMDILTQFGALVTNGQEELASLSYLITLNFCFNNRKEIERLGDMFEEGFKKIANKYADDIPEVCGKGLLNTLHFRSPKLCEAVAKHLGNVCCIDTTTQIGKPGLLSTIMFKPPVNSTEKTLQYILDKIDESIAEEKKN